MVPESGTAYDEPSNPVFEMGTAFSKASDLFLDRKTPSAAIMENKPVIQLLSKEGSTVTAEPSSSSVSAAASTVSGIDVSHYQGEISWPEVVGSGVAFVYIKATQGLTGVDSQFQANWNGARGAGLLRGAYHFYQPGDDPEQQADHFLNTVPLGEGDLPPALDVEISNGQSAATIIQGIETWLKKVQQSTGQTPVLYTDPSFWATLNTSQLGAYSLWIAEYGNLAAPKVPAGWKTWTFWQHSETGTIPGVSTSVDLDVFQGSLEELRGLVKA